MNKVLVLSALLWALLPGCREANWETPTRGRLTVEVSEPLAPAFSEQARRFERIYPQASIVIRAVPTRHALADFANGRAGAVVSDRPLNREERAATAGSDMARTVLGYDGLALLVNAGNRISAIRLKDIGEILNGNITNWDKFRDSRVTGPILLVGTGRNSGSFELLSRRFFRLVEADPAVFRVPESLDVVEYVAGHPGALGMVPYSFWYSLQRTDSLSRHLPTVRLLELETEDASDPSALVKLHQASIHNRTYPLSYPVYYYSRGQKDELAYGFSGFLASPPGQQILLNAGLAPVTMPTRVIILSNDNVNE